MACARRDIRFILVALGGTATIDGGIGVAEEFGCLLFDGHGKRLEGTPRSLQILNAIALLDSSSILRSTRLIALCDVQNPLLGPRGAARMFGPQKGASPEQVERLEAGLENLVHVCRERGIPCDPDQPGAGAAGGLGFGLATFLGAKLVPGAPYVLDLLNFDERCQRADLIITGEGKMDMQTAEGKACAEVARRAERAGKPCIAVVGTTDGHPDFLRQQLAHRGVVYLQVVPVHPDFGPATPRLLDHALGVEQASYDAIQAFFAGSEKGLE
jgi:glycerate kinase